MKPNTVGRLDGTHPNRHPISALLTDSGFAAGTIVLSLEGEMPVEYLSPGDRLITRDSGMARLEDVSRTRQTVRAISFAAGSLGDTRPDQDLILPAGQPVLIRDWRAQAMFGARQAMVRADALVDGEFVRDLGLQDMVLHQLHFAAPHVIYAGGLEVASAAMPTATRRRAA